MYADMMRFGNEASREVIDDRYFNYHPAMWWASGGSNALWFFGILCLVTWILFIVLLIALIRWFWKKGDNETRRR